MCGTDAWATRPSLNDKASRGFFRRLGTLLQLGVFGFGLLKDGNVGVGVFPEAKKILIRRLGFGFIAR